MIEVKNLKKSFADKGVLTDISLFLADSVFLKSTFADPFKIFGEQGNILSLRTSAL